MELSIKRHVIFMFSKFINNNSKENLPIIMSRTNIIEVVTF